MMMLQIAWIMLLFSSAFALIDVVDIGRRRLRYFDDFFLYCLYCFVKRTLTIWRLANGTENVRTERNDSSDARYVIS